MYPAHFLGAMTVAYASYSGGVHLSICPSAGTLLLKAMGTCPASSSTCSNTTSIAYMEACVRRTNLWLGGNEVQTHCGQ